MRKPFKGVVSVLMLLFARVWVLMVMIFREDSRIREDVSLSCPTFTSQSLGALLARPMKADTGFGRAPGQSGHC